MIKITALILSAGLSQRMEGRLKPIINYKGTPFLIHVIKKVSVVCRDIVIVTGYKALEIQNEINSQLKNEKPDLIKNINWCHNPDFEQGMLRSLQTGLSAIHNADWILYHFTDQPSIPDNFYHMFIKQIDNDYDWLQPKYMGKSGHPILFSRNISKRILTLESSQSLRDISRDQNLKHKIWHCDFPEILTDYDTPGQLRELEE